MNKKTPNPFEADRLSGHAGALVILAIDLALIGIMAGWARVIVGALS
jgi:hypothetical protein